MSEIERDETQPEFLEERDAPQFATMRMVDVQRSGRASETRWRDDLQAGTVCPLCVLPPSPWDKHGRTKRLKRWKSTVYCEFCRIRWWSHRPI
jgi:hypothetical protein